MDLIRLASIFLGEERLNVPDEGAGYRGRELKGLANEHAKKSHSQIDVTDEGSCGGARVILVAVWVFYRKPPLEVTTTGKDSELKVF